MPGWPDDTAPLEHGGTPAGFVSPLHRRRGFFQPHHRSHGSSVTWPGRSARSTCPQTSNTQGRSRTAAGTIFQLWDDEVKIHMLLPVHPRSASDAG
jgi:hypothetical protein